MKILFAEQDVIDAVCVRIAIDENDGDYETASPEDVRDVELFYDEGEYFAKGKIYGQRYRFNEQEMVNAIALFLAVYHEFDEDRLLVSLNFDNELRQIGAEILIQS